jgi:hypothetical protein
MIDDIAEGYSTASIETVQAMMDSTSKTGGAAAMGTAVGAASLAAPLLGVFVRRPSAADARQSPESGSDAADAAQPGSAVLPVPVVVHRRQLERRGARPADPEPAARSHWRAGASS